MRKTFAILLAAAALAGCASTEMRTFVGKPVEETMFAYGEPVHVIEMSDRRRAYQYRWGGGTVVVPGQVNATAQTFGNITTVRSTSTPAAIYESAGCLITFIASDHGEGRYVVEEYRVPKQLVC